MYELKDMVQFLKTSNYSVFTEYPQQIKTLKKPYLLLDIISDFIDKTADNTTVIREKLYQVKLVKISPNPNYNIALEKILNEKKVFYNIVMSENDPDTGLYFDTYEIKINKTTKEK